MQCDRFAPPVENSGGWSPSWNISYYKFNKKFKTVALGRKFTL